MNKLSRNILALCHSKRLPYVLLSILFVLFNLAYCYPLSHGRKLALVFGAFLALCIFLCYVITTMQKTRAFFTQNRVFLLFLIVVGCFYMVIFPPFSVPDEIYHYRSAYQYSNLILFMDLTYMRPEDAALIHDLSTHLSEDLYKDILGEFSFVVQQPYGGEASSLLDSAPDTWAKLIRSAPETRVFAALAIYVGRLLGLGAIPVLYLGRIANLACFVLLVYWAVKITPIGKRIFMMICFLPMTLHVAASYSYDAGTIGIAFLLIAVFLKAIYVPGKLSKRQLTIIAVLSILLAPCKIVYATISFLVLLIPKNKFSNNRLALIYKLGLLAATLLASLLPHIPSLFLSEETVDMSDAAAPTYTLSDILNNPTSFAVVAIKTLNSQGDFWLQGVIGGSLGWFQVTQPWFTLFGFIILVLLAVPPLERTRFSVQATQRLAFIIISVVSCALILLIMYTSWTPNTSGTIRGVQGRYILPILPLVLLAFRGKALVASNDYTRSLIFAAGIMNAAYAARMFAAILTQ